MRDPDSYEATRKRGWRGHKAGDHSYCDIFACAAAHDIRMAEVAETVRNLPADDPRQAFTKAERFVRKLRKQGFPGRFALLIAELDCAWFDEFTEAEPTGFELLKARMVARRLSELKALLKTSNRL